MLGQGGIRLHHACTLEMADFLLLATRATVLVMDTTFLDGSWEDALSMTRRLHPLVASLICVDPIDGELIASAQELGGLGALRMPIELERLRSTFGTRIPSPSSGVFGSPSESTNTAPMRGRWILFGTR